MVVFQLLNQNMNTGDVEKEQVCLPIAENVENGISFQKVADGTAGIVIFMTEIQLLIFVVMAMKDCQIFNLIFGKMQIKN